MPPVQWLIDELLKLWDAQPKRVAQALVVGAYLNEQISLAKAAELLGMDRWTQK